MVKSNDFILDCASVHEVRYRVDGPTPLSQHAEDSYCDGTTISVEMDTSPNTNYGVIVRTYPAARRGKLTVDGTISALTTRHLTATLQKKSSPISPRIASPPHLTSLAWAAEFDGDKHSDLFGWKVANNSVYGAGGGSTNIMRSDDRNVRVEDGRLTIQAHRETPSAATNGQPFSSGYLTSGYVLDFSKPGRLDARINPNLTPARSKGKWPGLWLRNRGSQELDVTEMIGTSASTVDLSNHWQSAAHFDTTHKDKRRHLSPSVFEGSPNSYHLWSTIWDGDGNIWIFCDGNQAAHYSVWRDAWVAGFVGMFQIRLDEFIQGVGPGPVDNDTEFETGFQVDYLRYFVE